MEIMKKIILLFIGLFSCCMLSNLYGQDSKRPVDYVDPFIGTGAHGHTYPGATMPFGMVQLSPNSRLDGWDGVSGYHYTDSLIYGFTHTALNGTGVGDYCDILLMPVIGEPVFDNKHYRSSFQKNNEYAEAGYYKVFLDKPSVLAEMTTTTRVGCHKYTFPQSDASNIIIDLKHRDNVLDSWIEIINDTEIRGMRHSSNWAKDMVWYFHIKFSKPFVRSGIAIDDVLNHEMKKARGTNSKAYVGFNTKKNETIEVKVGLSAVDAEGALRNLMTEAHDLNFEAIKKQATETWNKELQKIQVRGGSKEQNTVFYTAMYHSMIQPNVFMDVDKRYRGIDRNIHTANNFTNYTIFSLWDTYRAWHPLMTIIDTKKVNDFILTMLTMYDKGGLLPIWELAGNETYCMIGNHSIAVIVDAYMKGIRDFDEKKALDAMLHSVSLNHFGLDAYRKYGYIPGDKEHESISKTLEYAYDDWCIALYAKALGRGDLYPEFIKRAQSYKNILDAGTGFMRPKINGGWLIPFDPTTVDWNFTEANSWQYSFYVPQDITGFYTQLGGKERMIELLDNLFNTENKITGRDMKDITGLIGQYAHGNEPSHHMAYLYNFVNQPWKTQYYVRRIMDEFYTDQPDGLIGNEDCGQMSAWLVMSSLGFYPVTPGLPEYVIGTPWFPEAEINLENGKIFKITANNVSASNSYIQSVTLNDEPYRLSYINHQEIMNGGHLHFEMGRIPNKNRAIADDDTPVTSITDYLILPVPVINAETKRIKENMKVTMDAVTPDTDIYYTTDGSVPTIRSTKYTTPIVVDRTMTVKAVAHNKSLGQSNVTEADFVKINIDRKITLNAKYNKNYHAEGPEGLIDSVRGTEKWRLGSWQGYQNTDFEAIVDLGKEQPITYLAAGFLQDARSWIWMPVDVTFLVSKDGKTFEKVVTIHNEIAVDDLDIIVQDLGQKVNTSGRYVKVHAANLGDIPEWHQGFGGKAFIFIDEIIIE
jgi:predicted alpha-1,2-mannosidase